MSSVRVSSELYEIPMLRLLVNVKLKLFFYLYFFKASGSLAVQPICSSLIHRCNPGWDSSCQKYLKAMNG